MERTKLNETRKELLTTIRELQNSRRNRGSVMVARYNSILALRNSVTREITHLVDWKNEKNVRVLFGSKEELYMGRYEPQVAKQWINDLSDAEKAKNKETEKEIGYYYQRCSLSKKELENAVIKAMKSRLSYLKFLSRLSDESLQRF